MVFEDDPKLVRGLDYYTRTTFEFVHDGLGSQSAVGGGGRYDGLSEMIGGPALPSVGWALGVDRTVLALEAEGVELELPATTSVFAVPLGEEARRVLFAKVTELRKVGVAADFSYGAKGLKGAMKNANRSRRPLHGRRRRTRPRRGRRPAQGHGVRRAGGDRGERDRGGTGVEAGLRPQRPRPHMKHWGTSAKVISRVSPTRIADGRNSAIAADR